MAVKLAELQNYRDVDILFLGSSHCSDGFDPRLFRAAGYENVFNLGTASQTPVNTEVLLQEYLGSLNPKLVIYEVFPSTFCNDGIESSVKFLVNSVFGDKTFEIARQRHNMLIYNSLLYHFLHNMILGQPDVIPLARKGVKYIEGGYFESENVAKKEYAFKTQSWRFRSEQKAAFERIIEMLQSRDINYILVQSPISEVMYDSYKNNAEVDSYFSNYGWYVNFNGKVELDDQRHFFDAHHLNKYGVLLFNEKLIEMLLAAN
ncbi:MAG: hypothetical protein JXM68_08420 [Sedimentisphaerales bacterium]|nr:hypothetical protein [Sedimentisphaerales bacterium]